VSRLLKFGFTFAPSLNVLVKVTVAVEDDVESSRSSANRSFLDVVSLEIDEDASKDS